MSDYKPAIVDWSVIQSGSDDTQLYELSQKQVMALLSQTQFLFWKTRYVNLPEDTDLHLFASTIENQLMNGVTMDCDDVENCLLSSPTIASIVQNIQSNDNDISALQSQVSANIASIQSNDNDISALQSQVSANIASIQSNDNDISALQSQVSLNVTAIQANKDDISLNVTNIIANKADIVDHENRIASLENQSISTGGAFVLISQQVLTADGNFEAVDTTGYSYIKIIFSIATGVTGGIYVDIFLNGDTVDSNYRGNLAGFTNAIARSASNAWATVGQFATGHIDIPDASSDNRKQLRSRYLYPYQNANYSLTDEYNMLYYSTDKITSVEIKNNNGDCAVGSSITVIGIPEKTIPTSTLMFDFTVGNHPTVFSLTSGIYDSGNGYYLTNINIPLELNTTVFSGLEITGYEIVARYTGGDKPDILIAMDDGVNIEQFDVPPEFDWSTYTGQMALENDFRLYVEDDSLATTRIQSLRLTVVGVLPPELEPFVV